jgi:hypothetical protein
MRVLTQGGFFSHVLQGLHASLLNHECNTVLGSMFVVGAAGLTNQHELERDAAVT